MSASSRTNVLIALSILIGALVVPLSLEIGLRFMPINAGMPLRKDNTETVPYAFEPNTLIQYSSGWNLKRQLHRRVNNLGFTSDQDYESKNTTPLIAIVGDSYIEAMQVGYADTSEAQLSKLLGNKTRVYSFGAACAPLSQYLAWSSYVASTFHPRILVINVVGNDFDESLLQIQQLRKGGPTPGMNFFDFRNGSGELVRIPFPDEGLVVSLLRKSALASYLVRNVGIANIKDWREFNRRLMSKEATPVAYVGNTAADADPERLRLSKRAVDFFLDRLPVVTGMLPSKIIISVDGERPQLYEESFLRSESESYFSIMREYLIRGAERRGFNVIDLRKFFITDYKHHRRNFEFPDNHHWNGEGHRVLAESVRDLVQVKGLMD